MTLAEWTAMKKEEIKEEKGVNSAEEEEESLEEVEEKIDKGMLLIMRRLLISLCKEEHKGD